MLRKLQMFLLVMLSSQDLSSFQWWTDSKEKPSGLVYCSSTIFIFSSDIIFSHTEINSWALLLGYRWFLIHWRSWRHQRNVHEDGHRWWWYCFSWRIENWTSKFWFPACRVWSSNAYWSCEYTLCFSVSGFIKQCLRSAEKIKQHL